MSDDKKDPDQSRPLLNGTLDTGGQGQDDKGHGKDGGSPRKPSSISLPEQGEDACKVLIVSTSTHIKYLYILNVLTAVYSKLTSTIILLPGIITQLDIIVYNLKSTSLELES